MNTGVPTLTRSNSHSASGICIRMQPCETEYPSEAASGVPWMPTPGDEMPIQRVPSGLPGPGGIGSLPFAQSELGGYHQGCFHLVTTWKRPSGVGYCDMPVATRKLLTARMPL